MNFADIRAKMTSNQAYRGDPNAPASNKGSYSFPTFSSPKKTSPVSFSDIRSAMTSNEAYRGSGGSGKNTFQSEYSNVFPKYDLNQNMATGFGSVFGASSGSTGSSQTVQDSLNYMMNLNVAKGLTPEDAVNKAFDDFYFDQENLMDIPPGQVGVDEIFLNEFEKPTFPFPGGGGGGGGIGSALGDYIGIGGILGGGPKPGGYEEPKLAQQRLMQRMIDINRNNPFTRAAMGGIGSLMGLVPKGMMR